MSRPPLLFVVLALFAVTLWYVALIRPDQIPFPVTLPAFPSSSGTLATTAGGDSKPEAGAATPPPPWIGYADASEKRGKAVTSLFTSFVVTPITIGLLFGWILPWLWRTIKSYVRRPREWIVEPPLNSTSSSDVDKASAALGFQMRHRVTPRAKTIVDEIRRYWRGSLPRFPRPSASADPSLDNAVAALKDVTPGPFKPITQTLAMSFPRPGTRAVSTLLRDGDLPGRVGIHFDVTDLEGKQPPFTHTVWAPPVTQGGAAAITAPEGDNKDAVALYQLGELYWQLGAYDAARTYYEDALKKVPLYEPASKRLVELFRRRQTLMQRYEALLDPACRWLTCELIRRELIAGLKDPQDRREVAKVHNIFAGLNADASPPDYDAAISDCERAIEACQDWFQPYENLAIFKSYRGRVRGNEGVADQRDSISLYEQALTLLRKDRLEGNRDPAEARLKLGRFTSQILTGDAAAISEVRKYAPPQFRAEESLDAELLYSLACWHGAAHQMQTAGSLDAPTLSALERVEPLANARRCLVYALARERVNGFWDTWESDPDLSTVIGDDAERAALKLALEQLLKIDDLRMKQGQEFRTGIERVFGTWLPPQERVDPV